MATVTFDQINDILAEHQRAEEARNAPAAVACRALDTLREAVGEMTPCEWSDMRGDLYALIAELDERAWQSFCSELAAREG